MVNFFQSLFLSGDCVLFEPPLGPRRFAATLTELPPKDETSRLVGVSLCHLLKSICIFSFKVLYFFNEDFEPTDGTSRLADLNLS